jgi:hypothetical protein
LDLNQELFRVVNERIAEVQKRWGVDEIEVVCECANTGCTRRVVVPLEQYRRVRKHKGWFIVVAGQPHPADEAVIEQHGAYDIVASNAHALA